MRIAWSAMSLFLCLFLSFHCFWSVSSNILLCTIAHKISELSCSLVHSKLMFLRFHCQSSNSQNLQRIHLYVLSRSCSSFCLAFLLKPYRNMKEIISHAFGNSIWTVLTTVTDWHRKSEEQFNFPSIYRFKIYRIIILKNNKRSLPSSARL